ncbi:MAG: sensor histidine kinase [Thermodesulfovibrionales bacterium]
MEAERKKGQILFTTRYIPESQKIIITITDNGTGIPEENLSKIFDPFFTTKPVGIGTGLGLSISHGIVTEHGGIIRADNSPQGGAMITIELPVKTQKGGS